MRTSAVNSFPAWKLQSWETGLFLRCTCPRRSHTPKPRFYSTSEDPMKKTLLILTAALALLLATASAALGQSTGTISGIVSDQSGAIVAGANVRAQIPATNYKRETTTATNGFYRFNQLPVGVYTIE